MGTITNALNASTKNLPLINRLNMDMENVKAK